MKGLRNKESMRRVIGLTASLALLTAVASAGSAAMAEESDGETHTMKILGSLEIAKSVINQDNAPIPETFSISFKCESLLGLNNRSGDVDVAPGASVTIKNLTPTTQCTVTENSLTEIPGYTWGAPSVDPTSVEIPFGKPATVTVTNSITRDRGSLSISKGLSEGSAPFVGQFTLNYSCESEGEPNPTETDRPRTSGKSVAMVASTSSASGSLLLAPGESQTVDGIPTGVICEVTEELPAAPSGFSWSDPVISGSPTAPISKNDTTTVSVINELTANPTPPPPPPAPGPAPAPPAPAAVEAAPVAPEPVVPVASPEAIEPIIAPELGTGDETTVDPVAIEPELGTGVPIAVNAGDGPVSSDGLALIMWLLVIAAVSTAITVGLTRWINPKDEIEIK